MKRKYDFLPYISIVIPTLNNKQDLMDCLESLRSIDYSKDKLELIIWDNGSNDGTGEKIKRAFQEMKEENWFGLKLIENKENLGAYTSRAEALKELNNKCEYIFSLDDDVVIRDDCLITMLNAFKMDVNAGIIGARTVYFDAPNETAHGAGFVNLWLGKYSDKNSRQLVECDYVITCGCLIKKEVIDRIGGFDKDYYTSHGDVDLCLRAKKAGFKVYYEPNATILHKVPVGGRRTKERLYYLFRNKVWVIKKNANSLQKITSLGLYSIFWFPKIILDSVIFNKGININELRVIFKAVFHGMINKTGKLVGEP